MNEKYSDEVVLAALIAFYAPGRVSNFGLARFARMRAAFAAAEAAKAKAEKAEEVLAWCKEHDYVLVSVAEAERCRAAIAAAADAKPIAPSGTFECPICGLSNPHGHKKWDICEWAEAQVGRFGWKLSDFQLRAHSEIAKQLRGNLAIVKAQYAPSYGIADSAINALECALTEVASLQAAAADALDADRKRIAALRSRINDEKREIIAAVEVHFDRLCAALLREGDGKA
jgi:hypothetical protein